MLLRIHVDKNLKGELAESVICAKEGGLRKDGTMLLVASGEKKDTGIPEDGRQYIFMANAQLEAKLAVDAGYWHLYRYNPDLKKEGRNPFILDSKEPTMDYNEFIMGEVRYSSLVRTFPETAEVLLKEAADYAKEKYESYRSMAER